MTRSASTPTTEQTTSVDLPDPLKSIVTHAIEERASDVHVDVHESVGLVRFRTDGAIHVKDSLAASRSQTLINQIRVAARMDVGITQRPIEGHFSIELDGSRRNIRATIIPTGMDRRSAHLRMLTGISIGRELTDLGFSADEQDAIDRILTTRHGLVLISGPTGTGKTSTLYSVASRCDPTNNVVASIEDPIEFDMPLVRQLEVDEEHGLTMEEGLRALLRMDADVLMIGEIGDRESAQIAGQAALGGRLVLATIHGRTAAIGIEAMHHFGVPFYALGASLRLAICQRLIRRVCDACSTPRPVQALERQLFDAASIPEPAKIRDAHGCDACHGYGYRGRIGIFEVLAIDEALGNWLTRGPSPDQIRSRLEESAVSTFATSALDKVARGVTSLAEVMPLFGEGIDRPLVQGSS